MGSPVSVCRDIRLGGWGSVLGVCDRGARLAARVASATTTLAALKHYSNCQPKNDALAGVFLGGVAALPIWLCCVLLCCVVLCSVLFHSALPPRPRRAALPPAPRRATPTPHCPAPRHPRTSLPPPALPRHRLLFLLLLLPRHSRQQPGAPSASNPKKFRKYFGWVTGIGGLNVVALLIMDLWPINPRPKSAAAAASPPCSNADPFCLRLLD